MSIFRLLRIAKGLRFPVGERLYYRCSLCGGIIASMPDGIGDRCRCGNISINLPSGTLSERQKGTVRLMRLIA